jgi:hypothetical protein
VGTEVIGWSNERASQAGYVSVPAEQLVEEPEALDRNAWTTVFVEGADQRFVGAAY